MVARQLDIVRLADRQLCIVLQHDLLSDRRTRVVVPLLSASEVKQTPHLHPKLRVGRKDYIAAFELIGAVDVSEIDAVLGSAAELEYEIKRAYDMVIGGI